MIRPTVNSPYLAPVLPSGVAKTPMVVPNWTPAAEPLESFTATTPAKEPVSQPETRLEAEAKAPALPAPTLAPKKCEEVVTNHQGVGVRATAWGALLMEEIAPAPTVAAGTTQSFSEQTRTGFKQPVKNALIVGGGPGGLAAAIKMAEQGIKVTVVEVRDSNYQRPHHLNARMGTLEGLAEFGVYDQVKERSGWDDSLDPTKGRGISGASKELIESESVAQIRISDVEKALYDRVQELGIEYVPHHRAHLGEADENGMYSVELESVEIQDGRVMGTGQRKALGRPDLVVVADGAGSPTRNSLNIAFLEESEPRVYLGGQVNQPLGDADGGYAKVATLEGKELRHYMATGHKKYPQTWVSVEADSTVRNLSPEERTAYLAKRASLVMEKRIKPEDIGWGAGQITVVQNRRAEKTAAGNNVILIGDSARTGSVWQSGGLNLALTSDIHNLMKVVEGINDQGHSREHALKAYDLRAQGATTAWHKAGERELSGMLPRPEDNVPLVCLLPGVSQQAL